MRLSRRQFLLAGSALAPLGAQDDVTFKTEVKVVNMLATVLGKKGEIIRDLSQTDFQVSENGRPQAIRYFSRQSDLPLTLGIMVDTSMSQQKVLTAERGACYRFLDQVLREEKDKAFVMQFDMIVQLKQELTSSRKKLEEVLDYVDTPTFRELQQQRGGGTLLYDAIISACRDVMKPQSGRKALILLTDGVDTGSQATVTAAIEAAQRAETLLYSIYFTDAGYYGGGPSGKGVLEHLSRETGGGFFEVSKKQSLPQIFDVIQDELRSQYNIGYISDVPVRVSEFRKVQLTTKQKGLTIQTREKYWAQR
jgi:VWFA-related protein